MAGFCSSLGTWVGRLALPVLLGMSACSVHVGEGRPAFASAPANEVVVIRETRPENERTERHRPRRRETAERETPAAPKPPRTVRPARPELTEVARRQPTRQNPELDVRLPRGAAKPAPAVSKPASKPVAVRATTPVKPNQAARTKAVTPRGTFEFVRPMPRETLRADRTLPPRKSGDGGETLVAH